MNELSEEIIQDLQTAKPKILKEGCCKSYLTPKGRCYNCPDEEIIVEIED